jgi:hypothetical protein
MGAGLSNSITKARKDETRKMQVNQSSRSIRVSTFRVFVIQFLTSSLPHLPVARVNGGRRIPDW